jgi:Family of unknown function (DUF5681)
MTSRKNKSTPYEIGYGKPPRHTQFRQGRSGNPGGRPRRPATERMKELALQEAYRPITVKEGGRALALPAIQAIRAARSSSPPRATSRRSAPS